MFKRIPFQEDFQENGKIEDVVHELVLIQGLDIEDDQPFPKESSKIIEVKNKKLQ